MPKLLLYNGIKWIEIAQNGIDGKDADEERIIDEVIKKIPKPKDGKPGKEGKSVNIKEVLDALKKGIIGTEHIRGLEQRLQTRQAMYGVGPSGALLGVSHDSTITGDGTEKNPLRVVSTGGGVSFETPTGDVDGVNMTYTVLNTPKYIIVDGVTYFEGHGYEITGLTITTDIPPTGFIRSAY